MVVVVVVVVIVVTCVVFILKHEINVRGFSLDREIEVEVIKFRENIEKLSSLLNL